MSPEHFYTYLHKHYIALSESPDSNDVIQMAESVFSLFLLFFISLIQIRSFSIGVY